MSADVGGLIDELVGAWGCWAPTLTHDAGLMAYVSDRRGSPELWVQGVDANVPPRVLRLSDDPVLAVRWSPDGRWLACSVATGGGVRSEVWVVRPDGSGPRRLAGNPGHAVLGPWSRTGHRVVVTLCDDDPEQPNRCVLFDPDSGDWTPIAAGALVEVLDLSENERFVLVRDGSRGAHFCQLLDHGAGLAHEVLPHPGTGSTDLGVLRPPPAGDPASMVAYIVTDAGQPRRALVAVPLAYDGSRGQAGALAQREDAELEFADADAAGTRVLLVWNVDGRSELEILHTSTGVRVRVAGVPGAVISGGVLARDGNRAVLAVEGPLSPRRLWELDVATQRWLALTASSLSDPLLVEPTLERFESHDGLVITGWLYRPADPPAAAGGSVGAGLADQQRSPEESQASPAGGAPAGGAPAGGALAGGALAGGAPAVVSIHGGPESQERPVFSPQHQVLAAAGMVVFAPNIRGSAGFGRAFVHADDRFGRLDAIADVAACADWLISTGLADPSRIAVIGRSYGGYATLMALAMYPEIFASGIDVCGMSDLLTFYRYTEPWIARAAITKYGDPQEDASLLAGLSPLRQVERVTAPLLVVHGELDTNVPISEAHQIVAALRALRREVEYLQLDGEGHEYRRVSSQRRLLIAMAAFLTRTLSRRPAPAGADPVLVRTTRATG